MDYITNLFPCITFIPAEVESPNYVTIYPGTYIPFTLYNIYPGTYIHYTQYNLYPRHQVRK